MHANAQLRGPARTPVSTPAAFWPATASAVVPTIANYHAHTLFPRKENILLSSATVGAEMHGSLGSGVGMVKWNFEEEFHYHIDHVASAIWGVVHSQ
jgi:hypothetical protein